MPVSIPRPWSLSTGLLIFVLVDLTLLGVGINALFGDIFRGDSFFVAFMAGTLIAGSIILSVEILRVWKGKRSARRTLSYFAVVLIALFVWRKLLVFGALAVLAGLGVALIYFPTSNAFFQKTQPRNVKLKGLAKATRKAAEPWRKKHR